MTTTARPELQHRPPDTAADELHAVDDIRHPLEVLRGRTGTASFGDLSVPDELTSR